MVDRFSRDIPAMMAAPMPLPSSALVVTIFLSNTSSAISQQSERGNSLSLIAEDVLQAFVHPLCEARIFLRK